MIQVGLRVLVWALVLGMAFVLFGPGVFDSGRDSNPVGSQEPLYLPPEKSAQLLAWERQAAAGTLTADERAAYEAEARAWQTRFWSGSELSVEAALADVSAGRRSHLVATLISRGLAEDEVAVFLAVVVRDRPDLLADR